MINTKKFVTDDGITIFRIAGKLISSSVDKLKAGLDVVLETEGSKVAVSFKDVGVIDSVAVGLMLSRARFAARRGGSLCFCELQPSVDRLFKLMDSEGALSIFETEAEALASLQNRTGQETKKG